MINENGSVILNGITDAELIMILQVKEKHEGTIDLLPNVMQPQQANIDGKAKKFYNQVKLDWRTRDGLKAIFQIAEGLLAEEKQGQQQ